MSLALLVMLAMTLGSRPLPLVRPAMPGDLTKAVGEGVMTQFVLPFELLALLMLAALLAAIYFARPEE